MPLTMAASERRPTNVRSHRTPSLLVSTLSSSALSSARLCASSRRSRLARSSRSRLCASAVTSATLRGLALGEVRLALVLLALQLVRGGVEEHGDATGERPTGLVSGRCATRSDVDTMIHVSRTTPSQGRPPDASAPATVSARHLLRRVASAVAATSLRARAHPRRALLAEPRAMFATLTAPRLLDRRRRCGRDPGISSGRSGHPARSSPPSAVAALLARTQRHTRGVASSTASLQAKKRAKPQQDDATAGNELANAGGSFDEITDKWIPEKPVSAVEAGARAHRDRRRPRRRPRRHLVLVQGAHLRTQGTDGVQQGARQDRRGPAGDGARGHADDGIRPRGTEQERQAARALSSSTWTVRDAST